MASLLVKLDRDGDNALREEGYVRNVGVDILGKAATERLVMAGISVETLELSLLMALTIADPWVFFKRKRK